MSSDVKSLNSEFENSEEIENVVDELELAKEIMCSLILFRDQIKLCHFFPKTWGNHLLYDKIVEKTDKIIDNLGESYFLSQKIDIRNLIAEKKDFILNLMSYYTVSNSSQIIELIEKSEKIYRSIKYECFRSVFSNLLSGLLSIKSWLDLE